jgi:DNA-binding NtrC family response regulator
MSAPRILVVDDETDIRHLVQEILADEGYLVDVAADAAQARAVRAKQEPDLILLDIWMPDTDGITLLREWVQAPGLPCPVVMMSGHGTVETAVEATRLGAFDFVEKPLSLAKLLRTVKAALEAGRRKRQDSRWLIPQVLGPVGRSRAIQQLREHVQRVALHDTAVLLMGETGTGKQILARYIHSVSPRASHPFVPLTASSVGDADAAVTLFGSEDSAGVRRGLLDEAHGGTLFIDAVRALSPTVVRLLLVSLERRAYTRVGGRESQALDVRVIGSTAASGAPADETDGGNANLLSRLNAVTIAIAAFWHCRAKSATQLSLARKRA